MIRVRFSAAVGNGLLHPVNTDSGSLRRTAGHWKLLDFLSEQPGKALQAVRNYAIILNPVKSKILKRFLIYTRGVGV